MLSDLRQLLQRHEEFDEEAVKQAAYNLIFRQFLLRRRARHRRHYDVVVQSIPYFTNLLDSLNFQLVVNEDRGYVGALPRDYVRRMTLDETLLLFALRYLYDDAIISYTANEDASVDISIEDFELRFREFTTRELPRTKREFVALLEPFVRSGVVEYGPDEELPEMERIRILPTVTSLLSGDAAQQIEIYLKAEDVDTADSEDEEP